MDFEKSKYSIYAKENCQHLNNETSNKINYIESVKFVNPQIEKSAKNKITIAGSYAAESNSRLTDNLSYLEFISSLEVLFAHSYGLKCLEFSEIAPEFAFPKENKSSHSSMFKKRIVKTKRRLPKLILKSQSGWSIPLRDVHLSLVCKYFDYIDELQLVNFIIDSPISLDISVGMVTFTSCSYFHKKMKLPSSTFSDIATLKLDRMTNANSLSLIDLVKIENKKLNTLIIDLASSIFYTPGGGDFNFTKFNPFFKLLCSGEGGYAKLSTLILFNFDLFTYLQHDDVHNQDVDSWVEPPTNNFETFIKYISHMSKLVLVLKKTPVKVKTCKRCGFKEQQSDKMIETLTHDEWKIFLNPLEFQENVLQIQSYDYKILYSVSKYT
ncbi:hypothetical protein KGF56_003840 [Candida oxycetoniae]|uniref:Uncharacterized protein n=1 Tax=Candida oxycetoniae TaxID=497107 RepID=A0AAI9SVE5_9ASCO|nr:uncharacterized protein KGF56_003840 [Candida oxycetoniae]KAI3403419.2 hypothetical protein KGF56_003840 [Candida oxycetoniae]